MELTASMSKSKINLQQIKLDTDLLEALFNQKKTQGLEINNQLISMEKEIASLKENLVLIGESSVLTASKRKEFKGFIDVATNDLASCLKWDKRLKNFIIINSS